MEARPARRASWRLRGLGRFCLQRSLDQKGRDDAAALLAALVAHAVNCLDRFDRQIQQDLSLSLLTDSLAVTPQMLTRCHAGLLASQLTDLWRDVHTKLYPSEKYRLQPGI